MMKLKLIGVLAAAGLLAGCASSIDQMRDVQGTGSPFTNALTEEYRQITVFEADEMYDWPDAGYFARKGLAAAGGEVVQPEDLANWDLPEDRVGELADARARLVAALDGGARDSNPEAAARAQGRFDCWVEQQEENHQQDDIAECRDAFWKALEEIEGAPMAMQAFIVYFDFDRANLTDAGQAVVREVLAYAAKMGTPNISVTGHADRSGAEDYNMALSLRRADTVREALIAGGVPADRITVAGRGEEEPAVPTEDGVAAQQNRRVEIMVQ